MALKQGDRGPGVQQLQEKLIETGMSDCQCVADGVYGKNTAYAVLMYQRQVGGGLGGPLAQTGIADESTLEMLGLPTDLGPNNYVVIDSTGGGV